MTQGERTALLIILAIGVLAPLIADWAAEAVTVADFPKSIGSTVHGAAPATDRWVARPGVLRPDSS